MPSSTLGYIMSVVLIILDYVFNQGRFTQSIKATSKFAFVVPLVVCTLIFYSYYYYNPPSEMEVRNVKNPYISLIIFVLASLLLAFIAT